MVWSLGVESNFGVTMYAWSGVTEWNFGVELRQELE